MSALHCNRWEHFNPRSPHGERPLADKPEKVNQFGISTHAPRTGSDVQSKRTRHFASTFQPTLPARGATPRRSAKVKKANSISTHAPRTGSDRDSVFDLPSYIAFQPTLPARGATHWRTGGQQRTGDFNPRSPHGERRCHYRLSVGRIYHFNPRSPHGERLNIESAVRFLAVFQPTLPARGATSVRPQSYSDEPISTHAPRTGSDCWAGTYRGTPAHFNPRSPHGERLLPTQRTLNLCHFNPRSPHGERPVLSGRVALLDLFQPTLPARGATSNSARTASPT